MIRDNFFIFIDMLIPYPSFSSRFLKIKKARIKIRALYENPLVL